MPENLASRASGNANSPTELNSTCSTEHLVLQKRNTTGIEYFADHAEYKLPNSSSIVTITTTDLTNRELPQNIHLPIRGETSTDSPDDNMANIVVHFEAPPLSPVSSASQSPQAFEFPAPFENSRLSAPGTSNEKSGANHFLIPSPTTSVASSTTTNNSNTSPWSPTQPQVSMVTSMAHSEIPQNHQGVLKVIETWIRVCSNDLDCSSLIVHEMRDFLRKISVLGLEYKSWCQKIGMHLNLEVRPLLSL